MPWLLRDVEIDGDRRDCRLAGGRITDVGPHLPDAPADSVLDGRGGALLPGLIDHHIHLLATAAAAGSVDLSGPGWMAALRSAPAGPWVRAIGARAELGRRDLDAVVADRPVRVQHRGGSLWTLNSAGVEAVRPVLTAEEAATGQVWRGDHRLGAALRETLGRPDLAALGRCLAALGITHVTDATPDLDDATVELLVDALPQHVTALGARTGPAPLKIVLPDHEPTDLDSLARRIADAHDQARPVALHSVTQLTLAVAIAALSTVESLPGDRIEHAAVCDDAAAGRLGDLGVVVVTQPGLVHRHGDAYLAEADPVDRPHLWRYGGLLRAGVPVVASSDAPYGCIDPWQGMAAARARGTEERVSTEAALRSYLTSPLDPAGPPRTVAAGRPADLCLLGRPLRSVLAGVGRAADDVAAVFIRGELTFRRQRGVSSA